MKRRVVWSILGCLVVGALLVSCAPAASPSVPAKPTAPAATAPAQPVAPAASPTATAPVPVSGPQYGGTVKVSYTNFIYFDPYRYEVNSNTIGGFALDRLIFGDWTVDRKLWDYPSRSGYTPMKYMKGQLLESWEIPDIQTCILHVRKGIRYHDKPPVNGREFNADDIVWNYQRMRTSPFIDKTYVEMLASVTKNDNYTVTLKLKPPPQLDVWINVLDGTSIWFVPKETLGKGGEIDDWKNYAGTGPFILTDYVADSSLTFSRNANYWAYDERYPKNRLPYTDTVKVLVIKDYTTWLSAMRTGKLDRMEDVAWQDADSLKKTNPELQMKTAPFSSTYAWVPRWDRKPYNEVKVRQAVSMSIDRLGMIKTFYGGWAKPFSGPIKEGHGNVFTSYENMPDKPKWTTVSVKDVLSYNPQKAKQLLAEAGYPNGFKSWIDTTLERPAVGGLVEVFQSDLAKIGITADIRIHEWGAFNTLRYGHKNEALLLHWFSFTPEPTRYFGRQTDPTHQFNAAATNDPVYNKMYEKMAATLDEAERDKQLSELNYYVLENVFFVSLPEPQVAVIWQPWIKGYAGEGPIGDNSMGALLARIWVGPKK